MSDENAEARLMRAFREAGWTLANLEVLYSTDVLHNLRKKMFPTPFIDLTIEEAVTEQALEEASSGHGMMYKAVRHKLVSARIKNMRELVSLTESHAVRIFGSSKENKTFRAVKALLSKHNLRFGMELS